MLVYNAHQLSEESKNELDSVVAFILKNSKLVIEIGMHTGIRGSDSMNLYLSQRQAEWIKYYFVDHGVRAENIIAKGYGESQPIIPIEEIRKYRKTDRQKYNQLHLINRRTELKIIKYNSLSRAADRIHKTILTFTS